MHATLRRYYGASILRIATTLNTNYQTKFYRDVSPAEIIFHGIVDASFYHVSPLAPALLESPTFDVNNPPEAGSQLGIVEEALPTREKFLESRREIKSPTATRVDDSASLMRE